MPNPKTRYPSNRELYRVLCPELGSLRTIGHIVRAALDPDHMKAVVLREKEKAEVERAIIDYAQQMGVSHFSEQQLIDDYHSICPNTGIECLRASFDSLLRKEYFKRVESKVPSGLYRRTHMRYRSRVDRYVELATRMGVYEEVARQGADEASRSGPRNFDV